jgi:hypothetical protein
LFNHRDVSANYLEKLNSNTACLEGDETNRGPRIFVTPEFFPSSVGFSTRQRRRQLASVPA